MTGSYRHGTYRAYITFGCRCRVCSEMQRKRVARNRADRLAAGRISHGTRSGYDAGCRCEECASTRKRATEREAERRRAARSERLKVAS